MKWHCYGIVMALLSGCGGTPVKPLWDAPVVQKEVEYIRKPVNCGPEPLVSPLRLEPYEPTVIPPLLELGIPLDHVPDWLTDHLDHNWIALSADHWANVDKNDIDKKTLVQQKDEVISFYRRCIADHNAPADPPATEEQ